MSDKLSAKTRSKRKGRTAVARASRTKVLLATGVVLSLVASGVILAQRSNLRHAGAADPRSTTSAPSGQQSPAGQSATLAPAGLAASAPAKEYIYAGGKLIATEEPPATTCTVSLSPTSSPSHPASGATGSFSVSAPAGCAWTASESLSWVSITSGASGSGNGTVNYSVDPNTGAARSGTITVTQGSTTQGFSVNQDGATCSFSITPTSRVISGAGGTGSFSVTASLASCAWTATSNAGFITITSPSGQVTGNGTVNYSVQQNAGAARSGTITVGQGTSTQTFTVNQGAAGNDAAFVSQSVPTSMIAGQQYAVSITMLNLGTTTWPANADYKLGSQNPQDNTTWGLNRVVVTSSTAPNSEVTFNFTVTAPATPGNYNFQWRMLREGVLQWFGALTTNVSVSVTSPAGGLVAHWKFDEATGVTAADSTGNGNTGTLTNGPTWVSGQSQAAVSFDGIDDIVTVGANGSLTSVTNNFTLAFWAFPRSAHEIDPENTSSIGGVSGQRYVLGARHGANYAPSGHSGAGVSVGTNGISVYEHAANYMPALLVYQATINSWTHIAVVYENRQPKLYVNGVLVRTGLLSPMSFVHAEPEEIGAHAYGKFDGRVDETRIYNRVLSASEIEALATLPCVPGIAPPPSSFPADTIWFDDQLPAGAQTFGNWEWDTPQKATGTRSHTEPPAAQFHQHYFMNTTQTLSFGTGDKIAVYVLINPCAPPREIMLQFLNTTDSNWDHRPFWGENLIWPTVPQGPARQPMGPLPPAGQWVRLEVPASSVGLEGKTIHGMAFTLWDGQAWFDRVSKVSSAAPTPNITSLSPTSGVQGTTVSLTINGSNLSGTSSVNFNPSTGITVSGISSTATQVTATVTISASATTGTRTVSVTTAADTSNTLQFTVNAANPLPQLTSISPSSVVAGSAAFTLTVNGSGFISSSTARVNGSNRTTSFVSANQLTAQIPASDIATAGSLTITVFNPAPGGGTSNGQALTVTAPSSCNVTTFSGSGTYGYLEGAGTGARWAAPHGGAVGKDPSTGNRSLFIADTDNHRIRMIYLEGASSGQSVLVAGDGLAGHANGSGQFARFNSPRAVAVMTNWSGVVTDLFVADTNNHVIRRLTWGNGWTASDLAGQAGEPGWTDGDPTVSALNSPQGITAFPGTPGSTIYIADSANNAIRQLDLSGNCWTAFSGSGWGVSYPVGITHNNFLLLFSEQGGHSIWQLTTGGSPQKRAGSGTAGFADGTGAGASFNNPSQVVWRTEAGTEMLYIADKNNQRIRKLNLGTNGVTTVAGTATAGFLEGACGQAQFNGPRGLASGPNGEFYVIDTTNNRIRKITQ